MNQPNSPKQQEQLKISAFYRCMRWHFKHPDKYLTPHACYDLIIIWKEKKQTENAESGDFWFRGMNGQRRPRSACADSGQDLRHPFTESRHTVGLSGQKRPQSRNVRSLLKVPNKIRMTHYENTPIQIYWKYFTTKKGNFLDEKFWYFFYISAQKHRLW